MLYLYKVINSKLDSMNGASKIGHCISIFSFFVKNDQL